MLSTASKQKLLLGMLNQISDRSKPVRLSLLAKIPPSLRQFYNPKLSEEQKENQVKSVHEVKLSPEQVKFTENLLFFKAIQKFEKVFELVESQHLIFMKHSTPIKIIQHKVL